MPPYVIDGDQSTRCIYIGDSSGHLVPYTMVSLPEIHAEITDVVPYRDISFDSDMSFTMTLDKPMRKGLIDILCGITWTSAAQRYIRSGKRQKEKERRRRLKHEQD